MTKNPCVYIMASGRNGTLYVGVTSNLLQRVSTHRNGSVPGFTARHAVHDLVWFEHFETMIDAIVREKQIKRWNRQWKINLIERSNLQWEDLWHDIST